MWKISNVYTNRDCLAISARMLRSGIQLNLPHAEAELENPCCFCIIFISVEPQSFLRLSFTEIFVYSELDQDGDSTFAA